MNFATRASRRLVVIVTVTLLAVVALATAGQTAFSQAGALVQSSDAEVNPGQKVEPTYVGRQVCAECHRGNFEKHSKHGHAMTFAEVSDTDLASRLAEQTVDGGEAFGTYHYREGDGGTLFAQLPELAELPELPIQYVLGSGHHARTFLSLLETPGAAASETGPLGVEHRVSCYPGERFDITAGHAQKTADSPLERYGSQVEGEPLDRCVYCHTTTARIIGDQIDNLVANVNCEKCHGPGSEHVRLARQSETPPRFSVGKKEWDTEAEIQLCGDCHRLPKGLSKSELRAYPDKLARFQPVGMLRSACYLKSGRQLRCSTCHNPHESNHGVPKSEHIKNCISCHDESVEKHTICPVDAKSGCIECHMPALDQDQGIKFHDHWIRVRDQG